MSDSFKLHKTLGLLWSLHSLPWPYPTQNSGLSWSPSTAIDGKLSTQWSPVHLVTCQNLWQISGRSIFGSALLLWNFILRHWIFCQPVNAFLQLPLPLPVDCVHPCKLQSNKVHKSCPSFSEGLQTANWRLPKQFTNLFSSVLNFHAMLWRLWKHAKSKLEFCSQRLTNDITGELTSLRWCKHSM